MGKLGDYLRETRETRKLTLRDVSEATMVRQRYLELLEQGRYNEMPSYVHVHGFLVQYSKFLGLDFQKIVKPLLDEECQKETFGKTQEELEIENETKKAPPAFSTAQIISTVAVLLIIFLAAYGVYTSGFSSKRAAARAGGAQASGEYYSTEPPAVVAVTPVTEVPEVLPLTDNRTRDNAARTENIAVNPESTADNTTAEVPDNRNVRTDNTSAVAYSNVTLQFSDDCWYRFVADSDNTTLIDLIAPAGTSRTVRFKDFFRLDIGNAGGISLQHNGKNYTGFGANAQALWGVYFRVDENGTLQQSRIPPTGN
jgi:cytoskeletal protein RodZ